MRHLFKPLHRVAISYVAAVLTLALLALPARAEDDAARAAALEAAFLYNFAKFTDWPTSRFSGGSDPVVFCVGAGSRMRGAMTALEGKPLQGRTAHVVILKDASDLAACHVLFVDEATPPAVRQAVALHTIPGLLTVSDVDEFSRDGDIVLFSRNNQLRFRVNLANARKNGISFSSKLLQLADRMGPQSGNFRLVPIIASIGRAPFDPKRS